MLDFHNILWVIPGFIFLFLYNSRRPYNTIDLSGWAYLFFIVTIASLTWLPAEFIVSSLPKTKTFTYLFEVLKSKPILTLILSIFFTFIIFLISQIDGIARRIFRSAQDGFYKKCIEWKDEEIFIVLKSGKAYAGVLWQYKENPNSRYESQIISFVPFISGYRCEKTRGIEWNFVWGKYKESSDFQNMVMIIPRSEIITMGRFNERAFEGFI